MQKEDLAIGIDLGTTFSCVGIYKNNHVEIIPNDQGNRITPSYIAFTESDRLIGEPALSQFSRNPTNTVFDVKRLIGRSFDDSDVQRDMKLWPFQVKCDPNGKPYIEVKHKGEIKQFQPEEISAMVLSKMKKTAEDYLGQNITKAVITVPAYFSDSQRQATKDAGEIAGIDVLRIINEPTAAAIAYGFDKRSKEEQNVLIFDLGGGTLDVSLLGIEDLVFEVKATAGNTHLGGEDFDNQIVEYCLSDLMKKNSIDIRSNPRAMRRLKSQAEKVKRILSTNIEAIIEVDMLANGIDFSLSITRAKFEELCSLYFKQCINSIEEVLKRAKISKSQVHEVVLAGGSSRIPKIIQLIKEFFNGKEPNTTINPEEAVAYGAAIQAAIINQQGDFGNLNGLIFIEVTPLSLGIETAGGVMNVIIPKNTRIPVRKTQIFTTYADNQQSVCIQVYEGERSLTKHNNLLGSFKLEGIPLAKKGVPQIEVTFDIDPNGILEIRALEKSTSQNFKISIENSNVRLKNEEIEKIVKEAEKFKEEDDFLKKNIEVRSSLENYIYSVKNSLNEGMFKDKIADEDKKKIEDHVKIITKWLQTHFNVETTEYNKKIKELAEIYDPIITKIYCKSGFDKD